MGRHDTATQSLHFIHNSLVVNVQPIKTILSRVSKRFSRQLGNYAARVNW